MKAECDPSVKLDYSNDDIHYYSLKNNKLVVVKDCLLAYSVHESEVEKLLDIVVQNSPIDAIEEEFEGTALAVLKENSKVYVCIEAGSTLRVYLKK